MKEEARNVGHQKSRQNKRVCGKNNSPPSKANRNFETNEGNQRLREQTHQSVSRLAKRSASQSVSQSVRQTELNRTVKCLHFPLCVRQERLRPLFCTLGSPLHVCICLDLLFVKTHCTISVHLPRPLTLTLCECVE